MPNPPAEDSLIATPAVSRVEGSGVPPPAGEGRSSTPASRAARPALGSTTAALRTLAVLATVAALVLARDVLIPVSLAAFVAFLLSPVSKALEKLRIPRAGAAVLCVLALAVGMFAVLWVSGAQAVDLARRLPEYQKTLEAKFAFLRSGGIGSPIKEASDRLKELEGALSTGSDDGAMRDPSAPPPPRSVPRTASVPVRIVPDEPGPLSVYGEMLGSALGPLGDSAVVILLAIFLLAFRVDVRDRLLALGSASRLGVSSQALEEAAKRVARYLLSNLAVNALYGTTVGIGVYLIGLPNAALWGLLCALLRFIPYVGTWIGAALPIAVSIAVFDGWGGTIAVFATILGLDVIIGNVVEPVVYGHRTGLSPLAVVLATVFWTWAWGIPGLLLAIPLTLCLAVVGRYIPGFGMFHVLLGDEPVLDPAERAYERLIALDAAGVGRVVVELRAKVGAVAADDMVLLAALRHAERDRRDGQLDEERYLTICDGVRESLDELPAPVPPPPNLGSALLLPAFAEADRAACEVLARHLEVAGISTTVGPNATTTSDAVSLATLGGATAICVLALPPFAALRVRFGIRRARSQAADARLLAVVLDPGADRTRVDASLRQAGAAVTCFSLAEVLSALVPRPPSVDVPSRLDGADVTSGAEAAPVATGVSK